MAAVLPASSSSERAVYVVQLNIVLYAFAWPAARIVNADAP